MKSSFCIDLQRFMLIPTKFPLNRKRVKNKADCISRYIGLQSAFFMRLMILCKVSRDTLQSNT